MPPWITPSRVGRYFRPTLVDVHGQNAARCRDGTTKPDCRRCAALPALLEVGRRKGMGCVTQFPQFEKKKKKKRKAASFFPGAGCAQTELGGGLSLGDAERAPPPFLTGAPPPPPRLFLPFTPSSPGAASQQKESLGSNDEDGCVIDSAPPPSALLVEN